MEDFQKIYAAAKASVDQYKDVNYDCSTGELLRHLIVLTAEMQLPAALDFYLDFLAQSKAFIDFWLGDSLNEDMWMFLYQIEPSDFSRLRASKPDHPKQPLYI